jgi:hypothetical protein
MKNKYFLGVFFSLFFTSLSAKIDVKKPVIIHPTSFAICIDELTFNKTEDAVVAYRDAIEYDGLSAYIIVIENETPDQIKQTIQQLYLNTPKLEGAVFIGDIPIPMLRDAQHLTSAFKMNQARFTWLDNSIPSDRFYEDFDLKFKYLNQDTTHKLCYYYSLTAESPQKIEKEIYSGRIKTPVNDESKYKLISDFLFKAAKAKYNEEVLDNALIFTGQGYKSESLTSWADEQITLREQFPQLFVPGGVLKNLFFSMDRDMKNILMSELEKTKLDFALFHAHGSEESQLLLDWPSPQNIGESTSYIKRFIRSKLRGAKRRKKDVEEAKKYYLEKNNIPEEWIADTFDSEVITADSIFAYELDLHSDDLKKFTPQAEFMIFDECFNGSFITENYIAGRYLFNNGNMLSACANSVNVLQNKWANEFLGLLNYGVSSGQWHKNVNYLENHILGDPTFHYKNTKNINLSELIILEQNNPAVWNEYLNNADDVIRSYSLSRMAGIKGKKFDLELEKIYKTDPSAIVRTEALSKLAASNSKIFKDILTLSINDPNEFIRRISAYLMGKIGEDKYIPYLIDKMLSDHGKRVSFVAKTSLSVMDKNILIKEYDKIFAIEKAYGDTEKRKEYCLKLANRNNEWLNDILVKTNNDSLKLSKRIGAVRSIRNYNFVKAIPLLLEISKDASQPEELRIVIIESLGWFTFNKEKDTILTAIEEILAKDDNSSGIIEEALKSKNRLTFGSNVPFTP